MTQTEALKLALDYIIYRTDDPRKVIETIKEALAQPEQNLSCKSVQARLASSWGYVKAQPEQEPVCDKDPQGCWNVRCHLGNKCKNTPPQPEQESVAMADYMNLMEKYVALKAAQPEQEPVAWQFMNGSTFRKRRPDDDLDSDGLPYWKPLYSHPPQRTWVGLTPENYNWIFEQARTGEHAVQLAEAILKEGNT